MSGQCGVAGCRCREYVAEGVTAEGAAKLVSAAFNLNGEIDQLHAEEREAMRDSLAIHAPAMPDWFQPHLGDVPTLPCVPWFTSSRACELASSYYHDPIFNMDEVAVESEPRIEANDAAVLIEWARELDAARAVRAAWMKAAPFTRAALWPWAYADAVLGARPGQAPAAPAQQPVNEALLIALRDLVAVIDAAGLLNLSNGVQLGQTSWFVKASDRLGYARTALGLAEALQNGDRS